MEGTCNVGSALMGCATAEYPAAERWLIAVDLDGTLLEPDSTVLPDVATFLSRLKAIGHILVVASGRRLHTALEVCSDGGGSLIMAPDWIMANERDLHRMAAGQAWVREPDDLLEHERGLLSHAGEARQQLRELLAAEGLTCAHYQTSEIESERGVLGLEFGSEDEAARAVPLIDAYLQDSSGPRLWAMRNRRAVVLRSARVGKGITLLGLCGRLGIPPERVVAVGDSHNDVDMLDGRYGYASGCPANAESCVKQAVLANSGVVSELPNGRGVVDVLRRFGLVS